MRILSAWKQGPQAFLMVVVRRGWRWLVGPGSALSHSVCTQQSILHAWLRWFARFGSMVSRPFYHLVCQEQASPTGPETNLVLSIPSFSAHLLLEWGPWDFLSIQLSWQLSLGPANLSLPKNYGTARSLRRWYSHMVQQYHYWRNRQHRQQNLSNTARRSN